MEISVIQAPSPERLHSQSVGYVMSPRDTADLKWPLSEGMQVSAVLPVWIAMIISYWGVKLLKLPSVMFVAQTVTIGEQKVCPESESLKFSTTPTPQVENPSDSDSTALLAIHRSTRQAITPYMHQEYC